MTYDKQFDKKSEEAPRLLLSKPGQSDDSKRPAIKSRAPEKQPMRALALAVATGEFRMGGVRRSMHYITLR